MIANCFFPSRPDLEQLNNSFSRYVAVTAGQNLASNRSKQVPSDGTLLVEKIPEQLSGRAMTDNGDNDTSVADKVGAVRGVPGDGESPMRTVSFRSSAESPRIGVMKTKFGAQQNDKGTATVRRRCPGTNH
jgi:hypothetical protein